MACTSGSVERAAKNAVGGMAAVENLQKALQGQESANKAKFYGEINSHLTDAKLTDAREISYNSDIKTEYSSEFSLDKIAGVVTAALKAAVAATDATVPAAATSPAAIEAYTDVVNTVAEAAKSKSTSSASMSFSMNRLSPGLYAFLYASSTNITDVDTFGTEAVTTTAIYYRFMQSIDDVKNQAAFGAAIIDAQSYLKMKTLQAGLLDALGAGSIDIDEFTKKDNAYDGQVKKLLARLKEAKFDTAKPLMLTRGHGFGAPVSHSFAEGSAENQELVRAAIKRLSAKGDAYKIVIKTSEARLACNYY